MSYENSVTAQVGQKGELDSTARSGADSWISLLLMSQNFFGLKKYGEVLDIDGVTTSDAGKKFCL